MDTSSLDNSLERLSLNSDKEDETSLNNTDDQDELFKSPDSSDQDNTDEIDTNVDDV